jgi:hypothetical protein
MYIRVISLHFEASVCRERGGGERERERGESERERVCVCLLGGGQVVAAIVLDLVLLGAVLLAAVAELQELAGADLGVVLCESDKGFKGL